MDGTELYTMPTNVSIDGLRIDLNIYHDVTVPINLGDEDIKKVTAFNVPFSTKNIIYSRDSGASCECDIITICPHTHGTHLETGAHIGLCDVSAFQFAKSISSLVRAVVLVIPLIINPMDSSSGNKDIEAVILRTGWMYQKLIESSDRIDMTQMDWPVTSTDELKQLFEMFPNVKLIMVDTPSLDLRQDSSLPNHHLVFSDSKRAIVEFLHVPPCITEGVYILSLRPSPIASTDAIPCWPLLYPVQG